MFQRLDCHRPALLRTHPRAHWIWDRACNSIAWARERSRTKTRQHLEKEIESAKSKGFSNSIARTKVLAVALGEFYAAIGVERTSAQVKAVRACVRACMRACERANERARVRACVC